MGLRGRKKQEAGENSILRSFMNCIPHNYSSHPIKVDMGRATGRHVEDKHRGFWDKKRTNEAAVPARVKMERYYNRSERNRVEMRRVD